MTYNLEQGSAAPVGVDHEGSNVIPLFKPKENSSEQTAELRKLYKDSLVKELSEGVSLPNEKIAKIELFQCVPVGSFENPASVKRLIHEHTKQSLDPQKRALVLFVNGHDNSFDKITKVIEEAQHENPDSTIIPLVHCWSHRDAFSVGMMRAIPTETVRALYEKSGGTKDPIIVSNDADTVAMKYDYLENLNNQVYSGTLAGDLSRFEFSGTNVLYDLNLSLDDIDRELRNDMLKDSDPFGRRPFYPPGSNSAFRLSDYNGYDLTKIKGEDSELTRDFLSRGKKIDFLADIPVYTDPRRIICAFQKGKFVHEAWDTWEFSGNRGREAKKLEPRAYNQKEFEAYLNEYFSNRLLGFYQSKHNKCDDATFIKKTNEYMFTTLSELRSRLPNIGAPDLDFEISPLIVKNEIESVETFLRSNVLLRLRPMV